MYVGGKSGNFINISLVRAEGHGTAISGRDARNIDKKIDDGVADSGKVSAGYVDDAATGCASGEAVENEASSYNLATEASYDCEMFYWLK